MRRFFPTVLLFSPLVFAATKSGEVTFNKDVAPVLQKHCAECHRPGEAAPMPLLTYTQARPWAKAIQEAVTLRKMPPWFADPKHGRFSNDRRLSDAEIATISSWVAGGAKEGSPADAPKPVHFAEGWSIGKPDVVLEMPQDFEVPANGTVDYTWFVVPTGFTEDKWIEKIEVRPGDRSVVHHVVMFTRPPGSAFAKDAKFGVPFSMKQPEIDAAKRPPQSDRGGLYAMSGATEMVAVYVPGGVAYQTRPGQARLIKAGSDILFQMHYTANGKVTKDRSKVGMVFAKEQPKERVINSFIMNSTLRIPPKEANHRVDGKVTLYEDVAVQALFPHMHLRGKSFEYQATLPNGEKQVLLSVPKYDFNWQLSYYLSEPVRLPKGTVLSATAYYDNSPNNPANPDPSKEVYWGDQSWEEMFAGFVDFVIPAGMNPRDIAYPKTAAK